MTAADPAQAALSLVESTSRSEDARKPRLTNNLLDDLSVALGTLTAEAEYLDDAVKHHQQPDLLESLQAKRVSIHRARDWLARFIDATRQQRAPGQEAA